MERLALTSALSACLLGSPPITSAQAPVGTVLVAHGGDSVWNAAVLEAASAARTGGPVEVSFLMGPAAASHRFQDAVGRLEAAGAAEIAVVPLLVSSHSGHYDQIRWLVGEAVTLDEVMQHHLHHAGIERPRARVRIHLTPALDAAPELATTLSARALEIARTQAADPATRALLIVGHGPNSAEEYAAWMRNLRPIADSVRIATGFRDVRVELLRDDAPPEVRAEAVRRVRDLVELQAMASGSAVLVVPILISKGSVSRSKLPSDLRGTPALYIGEPLLPHPAIVRWIERQVGEIRTRGS